MNRKMVRMAVLLSLLFVVTSCTSKAQSEKEETFSSLISIPPSELNNQLEIDLPENIDYLKIGDTIVLWLKNNTENKFVFQTDSGIHIYIYDNQLKEWVRVKNLKNYVPSGDVQISSKAENPTGIIFPVLPEIEGHNEIVELRIVIVGNVIDKSNGSREEVGAYLDVTLHPQE